MKICYNKLWKLLIDKSISKSALRRMADPIISPATMTKLSKGENINTDIIVRICRALDCDLFDIMELVNLPLIVNK